jgi:hypothetical protein
MEQRDNPATIPAMYLAHEDWSPRYEKSTFYTVKVEAVELLDDDSAPPPPVNSIISGKSNLPAYYYRVDVYCGHSKRSVFRRYSQFHWLYKQLPRAATPTVSMPPGTCFCQPQEEAFAANRLEQLREFLRDVLQTPGYASHPSVVAFLELNELAML